MRNSGKYIVRCGTVRGTSKLVQEVYDGEYKIDKLPNAAYDLRGGV